MEDSFCDCIDGAGHDKITFERMSRLARERPWASSTSQKPTYSAPPVVSIDAKGSKKVHNKDAEPLVWVDQTELFETSPGAHSSAAPPYQGVLDWYPDVSLFHLVSFNFTRSADPRSLSIVQAATKQLPSTRPSLWMYLFDA